MVYHRPKDKYGNEDIRYPENWHKLRGHVLWRDGYRCQRCGAKTTLQVHHIRPIYKGGTHHPNNLITLCKRCHQIVEKMERER